MFNAYSPRRWFLLSAFGSLAFPLLFVIREVNDARGRLLVVLPGGIAAPFPAHRATTITTPLASHKQGLRPFPLAALEYHYGYNEYYSRLCKIVGTSSV